MKQVGDIVKIREDLNVDMMYGGELFCAYMEKFKGQTVKISYVFEEEESYKIQEDEDGWCFTEEMFEFVYSYQQLLKFKEYFDELYGKGLQVANWHQNGNLEEFDKFYESALECMEESQ